MKKRYMFSVALNEALAHALEAESARQNIAATVLTRKILSRSLGLKA